MEESHLTPVPKACVHVYSTVIPTYTAPVYCDVLYIYMFVHNSITLLLNKAPVCWGISLSSPAHCPCHDLAAIIGTKEGTCLPELIS